MAETFNRLLVRPRVASWTDDVEWGNWKRHESYLRASNVLKPNQIDIVAVESLKIIQKTIPISRSEFQCRGLVVGYVQSGKTANFTAVAARAADLGYRLIIVLSGIHDSLRNQTQLRLNRELVDVGKNWISLTTAEDDFTIPKTPDGFSATGTVLVVAKKLVPILRRIDDWIELLGNRISEIPTLIIDDEADQASINTRGNRRDPGIDDDLEVNPNESPTITNGLIRTILKRIPKATYIAYTATPFANLFINPNAIDEEVGEDLFPRNFVVQLPRPEGYTGTEELFGVNAKCRDVVRLVDPLDIRILKSKPRRRSSAVVVHTELQLLPQSLCNAILAFCVAGAMRNLREIRCKPHTMLVHASHQKKDQIRIGEAIDAQISAWRNQEKVERGSMHGPMLSACVDFGSVDLPSGLNVEAVANEAIKVLNVIDVAVLNSETKEELKYDASPDRHVIAIGGNRLSRGLTLEGLTISYFLRTTTMVDSLLQMCRWYGFRTGYGDLIRLWTTQGIADWFIELSLVEQSLRDSILRLERLGKTPRQMQIAIRAHSDLLLTSKVKSRMQEEVASSWSFQSPQTILLPVSDSGILKKNLRVTSELLTTHSPTRQQFGGYIAYDVPSAAIIQYLLKYETHSGALTFRSQEIADWISRCNACGELIWWTLFIASPQRDRQVMMGSRSFGLVNRSPTGVESIGILIDPRHEGVDLPGGPENYRNASSFNTHAMKESRPSTNGLLMIYPLDPTPFQTDANAVVALAMSLPRTSDDGAAFVANSGVPM